MIFKRLAVAAAFAVTAWTAQAATISNVEAVVGGPVMNDFALNTVVNPATGVTPLTSGPTATASNAPGNLFLLTMNFLGAPNQFSAVSIMNTVALTGDFVDATDGAGFIAALFETTGGAFASDFGSLFRVTLSNPLFTDTTLDGAGFFSTTGILVEAVTEKQGPGTNVIPLPAGLVLMLTGITGLGMLRRRKHG